MLIRIEAMIRQFAMCHSANSVDEISLVEIFEPVLVGIVHVRTTVELVSRRVFNPILITSILGGHVRIVMILTQFWIPTGI